MRSHSRDSRYFVLLDPFARRWLEDNSAGVADILNIEMFPFHSNRLTHKIRPPHDTIKSYVWAPLREMEEDVVFAFGADWVAVCENLPLIASYGPDQWQRELKDPTYGNWQVNVYSLEMKRVVVSWQKGFLRPSWRRTDPGIASCRRRVQIALLLVQSHSGRQLIRCQRPSPHISPAS